MTEMLKRRRIRREIVNGVIQQHEPGIREITSRRKEIAAKICRLRERDKTLQVQQLVKMAERDKAVDAARIKVRDE